MVWKILLDVKTACMITASLSELLTMKLHTKPTEIKWKMFSQKQKRIILLNYWKPIKAIWKKTWMILKYIINKNRQSRVQSQFKISDGSTCTISNKQMISEKLNGFFINIGPSVADEITKQEKFPAFYLGNKLENSIFIEPVSAPELDDILKTLRKCAPGYDEINIDILNLCLPCIKHSLLFILNLSLLHGVFPNELKIANVLPLFKSDDPMKFNNYRPVSLLSILSKIFEKAMYSR